MKLCINNFYLIQNIYIKKQTQIKVEEEKVCLIPQYTYLIKYILRIVLIYHDVNIVVSLLYLLSKKLVPRVLCLQWDGKSTATQNYGHHIDRIP